MLYFFLTLIVGGVLGLFAGLILPHPFIARSSFLSRCVFIFSRLYPSTLLNEILYNDLTLRRGL